MVISSSDISTTLSGGSSNTNPDLSLGGPASSYPITGNRLFNDISDTSATNGIIVVFISTIQVMLILFIQHKFLFLIPFLEMLLLNLGSIFKMIDKM